MKLQNDTTNSIERLGVSFGEARQKGAHIFYQRCLAILHCTAQSLSSSPGGLRFKAGSQPWLSGLNCCSNKSALQAGC